MTVIPFSVPEKRDYYSAMSKQQIALAVLALAEEDDSCNQLLTAEEMDELNVSIQAYCIAHRLVSMGIVL